MLIFTEHADKLLMLEQVLHCLLDIIVVISFLSAVGLYNVCRPSVKAHTHTHLLSNQRTILHLFAHFAVCLCVYSHTAASCATLSAFSSSDAHHAHADGVIMAATADRTTMPISFSHSFLFSFLLSISHYLISLRCFHFSPRTYTYTFLINSNWVS